MEYNHTQEAAKMLFDHRLNKSSINDFPKKLIPTTSNEAYLIQD